MNWPYLLTVGKQDSKALKTGDFEVFLAVWQKHSAPHCYATLGTWKGGKEKQRSWKHELNLKL